MHMTISLWTGCESSMPDVVEEATEPTSWEYPVETSGPITGPVVHDGGVWVFANGALHRLDRAATLTIEGWAGGAVTQLMDVDEERLLVVADGVTHMVDTSSDPAVVLWDTAERPWGLPSGIVGDRILYSDAFAGFLDVETGEFTASKREFYHCYTGPDGACCPLHGDVKEVLLVSAQGSEVREVASYTTIDLACWLHDDGGLTVVGVEEQGTIDSRIRVSRETAEGDVVWLESVGGRTGTDSYTEPSDTSGYRSIMLSAMSGDRPISLQSTPEGLEKSPDVLREYVGEGIRLDYESVDGDVVFVSPDGRSTPVRIDGNARPTVVVHDGRVFAVFRTVTRTTGSGGNPLVWLLTLGAAGGPGASGNDVSYVVARSTFTLSDDR
ncbi:MAG: hypothetical protein KTR31_02585 [Myxococcales bacterium]|nr:hypothetical protein [Myxococcales bacterium]